MARWFVLVCVLVALVPLAGCGGGGPKPVAVSGTVDLDGKPLDDGQVTLVGEGGAVPGTFPVKDGKFDGQAKPGKKKVEVRAFKAGKATKMGDMEIPATPENYLPARFNTETTLTAEVTASGLSPNKFEVQSK